MSEVQQTRSGEVKHIRFMLRLAYQGDEAWHGPSLRKVLEGVGAEQAAARPIAEGHSIFELVHHITFWRNRVADAVLGEPFEDSASEDLAFPVGQAVDDSSWQSALADLEASQKRLMGALRTFPDERLDQGLPGKPYSFYFVLHGILHHDLYHTGQIALLQKG